MACCDGWDDRKDANGTCEECGEPTVDGDAAVGCAYSPVACEKCGWKPCDGSC